MFNVVKVFFMKRITYVKQTIVIIIIIVIVIVLSSTIC